MNNKNIYHQVTQQFHNNTELLNLILAGLPSTELNDYLFFNVPRFVLFNDSKILRQTLKEFKKKINMHFLVSTEIYSEEQRKERKKLNFLGELHLISDENFKKAHGVGSQWPSEFILSQDYIIYSKPHDYTEVYHEHNGFVTSRKMIGDENFNRIYNEAGETIDSLIEGQTISAPLISNTLREAFLERNLELIKQNYNEQWIIFDENNVRGSHKDIDTAIKEARERFQRQLTLYYIN